jgi:hypothetical protein
LRLDALEKEAAQNLAVRNSDVEWKQIVRTDLEVIKLELKRLHYTVKKAKSDSVAARAGAPKTQCSLFNPGPFSMTE